MQRTYEIEKQDDLSGYYVYLLDDGETVDVIATEWRDSAIEIGESWVHVDALALDAEHDQFLTDAEADADALASAGWGTDEDYGYYVDE